MNNNYANLLKLRKILAAFTLLVTVFSASILKAQNNDSLRLGQLEIDSEAGIDQLRLRYLDKKKASNEFPGYRVQIYNGRKADLLKMRSEFLAIFPDMHAYTVYDAPEYKLQIGDFRTRLESEKFLKAVVKEYGSGFIVRTMIKPPQLDLAPEFSDDLESN